VVAVSAYYDHTLALATDGSVYAFGEGCGLVISQGGEGEGEEGDESYLDPEATHSPQRFPRLVCFVPD
jgi:alpha-tubulin suppressor-like RCC1 family protein